MKVRNPDDFKRDATERELIETEAQQMTKFSSPFSFFEPAGKNPSQLLHRSTPTARRNKYNTA
jgi:hypothetical protein